MSDPEQSPPWEEAFDIFGAGWEEEGDLKAPASQAQIAEAEALMQSSLPGCYQSFLLRWNGGLVSNTQLFGIAQGEGGDLVKANTEDRPDGLPPHLICFAASLGALYCFDTSQAEEDGECPVLLIELQQGQVIPWRDSFGEWLDGILMQERELNERRGPQPMTLEEWESFLSRERAKLRRLSKTPASELSMPDPEEVRADLEGKIPVNPMHLKPE